MNLKRFFAVALLLLLYALSVSAYASGIYDYDPNFSYPYDAGEVKSSVLYDALDELNYIRSLIGVYSNVRLDDDFTDCAQHGAVLLDVLNTLTHEPERPQGMPASFYDAAYEGTTHSNLALSRNISLSSSLKLYMHDSDSYNIQFVAHRRWLMDPRMTRTGFGISTRRGYAATYVVDEENSTRSWPISDEYITWPANKILHPLTYFDTDTAWSVTLNSDVFATARLSDVNITLTRQRDGETWYFNSSESDGVFYVTDDDYAYDQCIIFRPDGVGNYRNGEVWRVSISGLPRLDGSIDTISYRVQFTNASTGYEEDYNPSLNRNGGGGGSGGCNAGFGAILAVLMLGIPRAGKSVRDGNKTIHRR